MPVKSEGQRKKQSLREKKKRAAWKALGLCSRCGKNRPPAGRRQCGQCGERDLGTLHLHRSREKILGDNPAKKLRERNRSIEIFNEALKGEKFGPNPGYADLKIFPFVYDATSQRQLRLPGLGIELLVSSESEVHQMFSVMRRAIEDWANGTSPYLARIDLVVRHREIDGCSLNWHASG